MRLYRRLGHHGGPVGSTERKQRPAIACPPGCRARPERITAEHIADNQPGHLAGGARLGVGNPDADTVALVDRERQAAAVRRPGRNADPGAAGYLQRALRPVRQPQDGKARQRMHPLTAGQHRVDADSGE